MQPHLISVIKMTCNVKCQLMETLTVIPTSFQNHHHTMETRQVQLGVITSSNQCEHKITMRSFEYVLTNSPGMMGKTVSCPCSERTLTLTSSPCFVCGRLQCYWCFGALCLIILVKEGCLCSFRSRLAHRQI